MDKEDRYVRGLQHALRTLENNADDLGWVERDMARAAVSRALAPLPLDMLLFCPECHTQHVDEPDERTPGWVNPPHRSHLCHACGCIWRPADVPTNGVRAIQTKGRADTWPAGVPAVGTPELSKRTTDAAAALATHYDELPHAAQRDAVKRLFQMVRDDLAAAGVKVRPFGSEPQDYLDPSHKGTRACQHCGALPGYVHGQSCTAGVLASHDQPNGPQSPLEQKEGPA